MEKRVEHGIDAGGEVRFDAPDKRSWRDKFLDRFERKKKETSDESSDKSGERKVSFVNFFKNMFTDGESGSTPRQEADKQSWIEEAFAARDKTHPTSAERDMVEQDVPIGSEQQNIEKINQLDEHTRLEFLMEVAERFRSAGERFMLVLSGGNKSEAEPSVVAPTAEVSPEERDRNERNHETKVSAPEVSPPFDFAIDSALSQESSDVIQDEAGDGVVARSRPMTYADSYTAATERSKINPVITSIIGSGKTKEVRTQGPVTTYIYTPRKRDLIIEAMFGESRTNARKINDLEKHQKEVEEKVEKLAQEIVTEKEREIRDHAIEQTSQEQKNFVNRLLSEKEQMQQTLKQAAEQVSKNPDGVAIVAEMKAKKATTETSARDFAPLERESLRTTRDEIRELSYADLEPTSQRRRESRFEKRMPRRERARVIPSISRPNSANQQADFERKLRATIRDRTTNTSLPNRIISNYKPGAPGAAQNWASTLAILAMVLISVLFISAI